MTTPNKRAWTLAAIFLILGITSLWVAEDALIPLRVVKQFWGGNGLVWNPEERIQVCTSLLWQLMILPAGLFSNMPLALGGISLLAAAFFGLILGKNTEHPWVVALLGSTWLASWSTREFMVSGLETPLAAILLAIMAYHHNQDPKSKATAFAIGMVPLARHDMALLALPFAIMLAWELRHDLKTLAKRTVQAAIPMTIQSIIAFWYYGSILPNTYYAKKFTGEEPGRAIEMGMDYLHLGFSSDWGLLAIPAFTILLLANQSNQKKTAIAFGAGALSYVVYAATTNDYMLCRFLVPPTLLAMALIPYARIPKQVAMTACIALGCILILQKKQFVHRYITDERATRFGAIHIDLVKPSFYELHAFNRQYQLEKFSNEGCIGVAGITAKNETYVCDYLRLSQPLLARVPSIYSPTRTPGHYITGLPEEMLPKTYWEKRNPEVITHPEIKRLAELIHAAHTQSVFDPARIPKIIELATFKLTPKTRFLIRYGTPPEIQPGGKLLIPQGGVKTTINPEEKILRVESDKPLRIRFLRNYEEIQSDRIIRENDVAKMDIPKGTETIHFIAEQPVVTIIQIKKDK